MSFSGSGFSLGDVQGRLDNSWSYQSYETISINRGKHLIKAGGSFVHVAGNRLAANLTQGTLAFSSNESGYDFASFLLGYPHASQTPQGYPGNWQVFLTARTDLTNARNDLRAAYADGKQIRSDLS